MLNVGEWVPYRDLDRRPCQVKVMSIDHVTCRAIVMADHGRDQWSVWLNDLYYQRGDKVIVSDDGDVGVVQYVDDDGDVIVRRRDGRSVCLYRTHLRQTARATA
jgi:hypothetical protein